MRILLVYPCYITGEQPLNIMYISAALKQAGQKVAFFEITQYSQPRLGDKYRAIKRAFVEKVTSFKPDLIGFSVMTVNYNLAAQLGMLARQHCEAKIIWGGIHPTVDPENTILEPSLDMICIGEGDEAVVELASNLESGDDFTNIRNIWVREDGRIFQNPVRPLIRDLDLLPYADRESLRPEYMCSEKIGASFITSRGCPFPCSYCQNKYLMELNKGGGPFVRYRSIENVIAEIKAVVAKYGPQRITFSDEIFTLNRNRAIEFYRVYKQEVGLPFLCQTRPDSVDEELLFALREAGCVHISMAIEAGNDHQRNIILNRKTSRERIINAFALAKKAGLRVASFNMIGVPYETEETIWDTININREIQTDWLICTIYMPFRGTELGELCEKEGWIKGDVKSSMNYYTFTALELPTISSRKLAAYQVLFKLYVSLPEKSLWWVNVLKWVLEKVAIIRRTSFGARVFYSLYWRFIRPIENRLIGGM